MGESMFHQVHPQKYYIQIVKQIRDSICDGKFKVGDKLPPERKLAEQFGTSRASIREALSALELLGIVESKGGLGNFIKADGSEGSMDGELFKTLLEDHSAYEIFESRLEVEPSIAALAAERATKEEKKELKVLLERLNAAGRRAKKNPEYVEKYMEEDRKFHLAVGRCAHNSVLFVVFSGLNFMMKEAHWKAMKSRAAMRKGNILKYEKEHTAIYEAIIKGKPETAKNEMFHHIYDLKEDLFDD